MYRSPESSAVSPDLGVGVGSAISRGGRSLQQLTTSKVLYLVLISCFCLLFLTKETFQCFASRARVDETVAPSSIVGQTARALTHAPLLRSKRPEHRARMRVG